MSAFAQATSSTTVGEPTCDLCGWCSRATNPKPANYDTCHTCLYNADGTEKQSSYYTVFGCISSPTQGDLAPTLVKSILNIVFGVSGGIAFLTFLHGTTQVLTSSGDPFKLQAGKDELSSSIVGLLLIIFSVFLLRTVGFEILQIPGFG